MRLTRWGLHLGWTAGVVFGLAVAISAALLPGYQHAQLGVGWLGSAMHPQSWLFNVLGFGIPGFALAGFSIALERRLAPWSRVGRIATSLLLIAGLAFALLGVLPLNPNDIDGPSSSRHAALHGFATLAWSAALVMMAFALRGRRDWTTVRAFAAFGAVTMLAWLLAPVGASFTPGWSERLQWGAFFAWPAFTALVALRNASDESA